MLRMTASNSATKNRDKRVWLAPIEDAHTQAVRACHELWNALGAMESVSLTARKELYAARDMTTVALGQLRSIEEMLQTVQDLLRDE